MKSQKFIEWIIRILILILAGIITLLGMSAALFDEAIRVREKGRKLVGAEEPVPERREIQPVTPAEGTVAQDLFGFGPTWKVVDHFPEEGRSPLTLIVQDTPALWSSERCPHDGGPAFCIEHGEFQVWDHLRMLNRPCEIRCQLPRAKCRKCGYRWWVRPPWEPPLTRSPREADMAKEAPVALGARGSASRRSARAGDGDPGEISSGAL